MQYFAEKFEAVPLFLEGIVLRVRFADDLERADLKFEFLSLGGSGRGCSSYQNAVGWASSCKRDRRNRY